MSIIKRCHSIGEKEIIDDVQASNSEAENSKASERTTDRALTIRSDNARANYVAQSGNNLDGHQEASLAENGNQNRESGELVGSEGDRLYDPSDFAIGDIVWAKCGKGFPTWPAIVIDSSCQAPPAVVRASVRGALCVMFYGRSKGEREYGWIKAGMVFPFDAYYMNRFQGQTKLYGNKISDFQAAINEGRAALNADVDAECDVEMLSGLKLLCDDYDQTWFSDYLDRNVVLDKIVIVVCNSVQGIYDPVMNLVGCCCDSCVAMTYSLNAWEKHTGSRAKKWRTSVRVHDSNITLSNWIIEKAANDLNRVSLDEQQLFALLKENYEPVHVKWTAERCVICRWINDWDSNRIIICNRCQIGVHEKCYGVKRSRAFASWICRACETPEFNRECCLCPIKGGALIPTNIEPLWAHAMCTWFQPEITFTDVEKMEPAMGLLRIPQQLFTKVCVICRQVHGSCIRCCKCTTYFHATCASRAGYCMELQCIEKNGMQISNWISYCAVHEEPRADNVLAIKPLDQFFSNETLSQSEFNEECSNSSRNVVTPDITKLTDSVYVHGYESEEMSSARCRIYKRSNIKRARKDAEVHRLMGPSHHSLNNIECLYKVGKTNFKTLGEHLDYLKVAGKYHVCFGKSRIHGWGLFARRNILRGQMIIEYRGEQVRRSIVDLREVRYQCENKDCYFFKINDEIQIDATNKGNVSRLLNHSCMPNCCARVVSHKNVDNRVILMALSNISTGEELTCDYLTGADKCDAANARPCMCQASNCKKWLE